ncbi:hypothetical protein [Nocardiopsis potens]|uniref:hypothetical protein n=1 Tax=Nocardiopsis potens TaxID=1246458 RepID=UPI00047684B5|nr:hypothetical protein [Nocardiopsis potens]
MAPSIPPVSTIDRLHARTARPRGRRFSAPGGPRTGTAAVPAPRPPLLLSPHARAAPPVPDWLRSAHEELGPPPPRIGRHRAPVAGGFDSPLPVPPPPSRPAPEAGRRRRRRDGHRAALEALAFGVPFAAMATAAHLLGLLG